MHYETTIDIAVPPAAVWAVLADLARWPEWTETVRSVNLLDPAPLVPGLRARVRIRRAPTATWTVTEVRRGAAFTWTASTAGIRTIASHEIEAAGEGSRVTLAIDQPGAVAGVLRPLLMRVARKNLAIEAAGLKRRAEAGNHASTAAPLVPAAEEG
ncbi:MAG: SRPBCC family protein [Tepidiformaceae bacterium]